MAMELPPVEEKVSWWRQLAVISYIGFPAQLYLLTCRSSEKKHGL